MNYQKMLGDKNMMNEKLKTEKWNYQEAVTLLFNVNGAFYAFSQKQYNEKVVGGVEYVGLGGGLVCPKNNASNLLKDFDVIHTKNIKIDLEDNGVKKIIWRELANYECQIVSDYSDAVEALENHGITEEQVKAEWKDYFQHCVDNNYF